MEVPRIGSSYSTQTQNKNIFSSQTQKNILLKIRPFLKYTEDYEENVKIIRCDNAGEKKIFEENCAIFKNKLTFNLCHQELHRKMAWLKGYLLQFILRCVGL